MAFLTNCTNRGCGKMQEPYLDQDTNEVFCSLCNQTITGITAFTKQQLKSLKQFKPKSKKSFAVKCNHCGKDERPMVVKNDLLCALCKKPLNHLTPTFKNMLKQQLEKMQEEEND